MKKKITKTFLIGIIVLSLGGIAGATLVERASNQKSQEISLEKVINNMSNRYEWNNNINQD